MCRVAIQGGISTFTELEERLKACFSKCPEMKEIVYHFANWDLDSWLKGAVGFKTTDLQKISFDNAWLMGCEGLSFSCPRILRVYYV